MKAMAGLHFVAKKGEALKLEMVGIHVMIWGTDWEMHRIGEQTWIVARRDVWTRDAGWARFLQRQVRKAQAELERQANALRATAEAG